MILEVLLVVLVEIRSSISVVPATDVLALVKSLVVLVLNRGGAS
jgi:hypothetical protein